MPHRLRYSAALLCLVLAMLTGLASSFAGTTSFHVGNSLTWDSQPLAMRKLAALRGYEHEVGYHIRSNASLNSIIQEPTVVAAIAPEYGYYFEALPNFAWDFVTMQPLENPIYNSTMQTDIDSILTLINLTRTNPANANTKFYIYTGWPAQANYQQKWTASVPDELTTVTTRAREYFDHLIQRVRSATDATVYMVPIAEVFYELDVRMKQGLVPGLSTVSYFYRDAVHMNSAGSFIAGLTTMATMFGETPLGITKPTGAYGNVELFTAPQYEAILETIRSVIDASPYSGVSLPPNPISDFNGDRLVDAGDFQVWQRSFGIDQTGDVDANEVVNGQDFLSWQRAFVTTPPNMGASPSDLNHDEAITAADLAIVEDSFGVNAGGDIDKDGDTDGQDILNWQRDYPVVAGDLNKDLLVDQFELSLWQNSYSYLGKGDGNQDGKVDGVDFLALQREYGREFIPPIVLPGTSANLTLNLSSAQYAVPEPVSLAQGVLLFLVAQGCRVRSNKG
jgi:hypothetical protein